MEAPRARKIPHRVPSPWGERSDHYYWLRDDQRQNPEMLAYLAAENDYAAEILNQNKALAQQIYDECLARINEEDSSLAYRSRGYWYYSRTIKGLDYSLSCRRRDRPGLSALVIKELNERGDFSDEELLLDKNELAKGHDYYSAAVAAINNQRNIMAWIEDTNGRRQYTVRFRDLNHGTDLPDLLENCNGSLLWAEDGRQLFYIENDPQTLLSKRIYAYDFDSKQRRLVYEERDDSFYLSLDKTRDRQFILICCSSTVSDEVLFTAAANPGPFRVFAPRQRDLEYGLDHFNGRWYIRTNRDGAENFKIMTAADAASPWQEWLAHDGQVLNYGVELFDDFAAVAECSQGLTRIKIIKNDGSSFYLAGEEDCGSMDLSVNAEADSPWLRYGYSSLITPASVYELNILTGEKRLLKTQEVKHYRREDYQTERLWLEVRDGEKVPVSLVYRRDTEKPAPLLLYGYGSYGHALFPGFSSGLISLLDRGLIYAIAHVRGGEELGRQWYDRGRLLQKKNTFNDFIDVSRALVDLGYGRAGQLAASGGSAGGLLMGVIANEAPELYRVIIAQVPFVDVVTTMLDPSIPLTTNEYDEWGNPEQSRESYDYMLSYSPYDNLRRQCYPAMFVGAGLWDSQVQYWEPAKYVARLRELNQGPYPIVLKTNMEAGHGGKSGRYQSLWESAEVDAFMLNQLGLG